MSNTPQTLKDGAIALVIALFLIALGALGAYFPLKRHFQAKLEALKPEVVQVVTERLDTAKFAPKEPIEKDVIKYIRIPVADSSAIESLIRDKDALLADVARLERNNDSLVLVLKREQKVYADNAECVFLIPYSAGNVASYLMEQAQILSREYREDGILIHADCHRQDMDRYREYIVL